MDDLQRGLHSAMARVQLAEDRLAEEPESVHWHRVWRDSLDLAVKWQRELRRVSPEDDSFDEQLDKILGSK